MHNNNSPYTLPAPFKNAPSQAPLPWLSGEGHHLLIISSEKGRGQSAAGFANKGFLKKFSKEDIQNPAEFTLSRSIKNLPKIDITDSGGIILDVSLRSTKEAFGKIAYDDHFKALITFAQRCHEAGIPVVFGLRESDTVDYRRYESCLRFAAAIGGAYVLPLPERKNQRQLVQETFQALQQAE